MFGQPGSGKSFGIGQITTALGGSKPLSFNVAQFESAHDLTVAFHAARTEAIKGHVPILFFDEFDVTVGNRKLYWLQHFLAAMQDGVFKDGNAAHSIGKSIFVFAGGVYPTFREFDKLTKPKTRRIKEIGVKNAKTKKERTTKTPIPDEARDAKPPDFISRLRGFIDILGPNPTGKRSDNSYLIRRAVVLRSLLKDRRPQLFDEATGTLNIRDNVLRAFLEVPEYIHGVRSIEALIDMSMLADRSVFDSSALPTDAQMSIHVNSTAFLGLIARLN